MDPVDSALSLFSAIPYIALAIIALIVAKSAIVIVPEKQSVSVLRLGQYNRTLKAGLRFKLPWPIESTDVVLSHQVNQLEAEIKAMTQDKAFVSIPVKVQHRVLAGREYQAAYELDDPEAQIKVYIENVIRTQATTMDLNAIFGNKDAFENAVEAELKEKFGGFGYEIVNVLVDQPQPSGEMAQAFERVLRSKREQEAATNEAAAIKIKRVGEAEAEAESLRIKSEMFVKVRKIIAEGNSEAMQEFLKHSDGSIAAKDVLAFFAGIDERDALRDASSKGAKVVYIAGASRDGGKQIGGLTAGVEAAQG